MNPTNVTLRQLRAFLAISETGSFAAAALRLSLTPSALSLLIKELESNMEVRLFDRTTRNTSPSLAGTEFYPLARKVLDDLALAFDSTRDLEQKKRGTVRVACTPLYASTTLPELSLLYRQKYPAISVFLLDSLNEQVLARVISGEADIGVAPQRPTPPELTQESLLKDPIWLICRPDHYFATLSEIKWAQVLSQPFVSLTRDFTSRLQADLLAYSHSLLLSPTHEVSLITTALGMVKSGYGVTAQPARCLPLIECFGLIARPLIAPVVNRHLSLFCKKGYELSPAAASFRDFLFQELLEVSK